MVSYGYNWGDKEEPHLVMMLNNKPRPAKTMKASFKPLLGMYFVIQGKAWLIMIYQMDVIPKDLFLGTNDVWRDNGVIIYLDICAFLIEYDG